MSVEIRVTGAEQFGALARRLKKHGDNELRKELYRGINRTVKPIRADVKANIPSYMPSGYSPVLQKSFRLSSSRRATGRDVGIRLLGRAKGQKKARAVGDIDKGSLRHPTFGRRKSKTGKSLWFVTKVRKGFFTERVEGHADSVRRDLIDVMNDVANKIAD